MKRLLLAAAFLCAPVLAVRAQLAPAVRFTAVDSFRISINRLEVTGIVEGETAPRQVRFDFGSASTNTSVVAQRQSCERLILLAIAKPGQYVLQMEEVGGTSYALCTLERVVP